MAINFRNYVAGQVVLNTDLLNDQTATRNLVGLLATLLAGTSSWLPTPGAGTSGLAVSGSGSALSVTIGGTGQEVVCQGKVCDTCPATTFSVPPNNSGSPRVDLIEIQYAPGTQNPHSGSVYPGPVLETIYDATEQVAYQYKQGTTTPDSGWVGFATVTVPSGATTGSQCTITYLFQTFSAILQSIIGGVTSITPYPNGNPGTPLTGAIELVPGVGITVGQIGNAILLGATVQPPYPAIYKVAARIPSNIFNTPLRLTLPVLATGNYTLVARAMLGLAGGSLLLAGSGLSVPGSAWESPSQSNQVPGLTIVELTGNAQGGDAPSCVLSTNGNVSGYYGLFTLEAAQ